MKSDMRCPEKSKTEPDKLPVGQAPEAEGDFMENPSRAELLEHMNDHKETLLP